MTDGAQLCARCDRPIHWVEPGSPLPGYWAHDGRAYGHLAVPKA